MRFSERQADAIWTSFVNGVRINALCAYFRGMMGAIIELLLSWVLLRLVEHRGLSVLGLRPTGQRLGAFIGGLVAPVGFLAAYYVLESLVFRRPYRWNPVYGWKDFGLMSWYLLKSVAFEDLLFRGALLYIVIRRWGPGWGCWLSAVAFGVYHWFSFGVIGQPANMIFVFLITGLAGYVFARAFQRSGSMYLGAALHFSTDWAGMGLFGVKNAVFIHDAAGGAARGMWVTIGLAVIHFAGFLLFLLWFVGWVTRKRSY